MAKIKELKNAPEWLVQAQVSDEHDVEINQFGKVIWNKGDWHGGEFRGGYFLGGEFLGGYFLGGEFLGGEFLGGIMLPRCRWSYGMTSDGKIRIGCETKTIEEWDKWFMGTDEYSTKRGTERFMRIQASYEAAKAYMNFLKQAGIDPIAYDKQQ